MSLPTVTAVRANPMIIMTQTVVAAGARIDSGTRLDIKAKSDVPVALTPNPMQPKATRHMAKPVP